MPAGQVLSINVPYAFHPCAGGRCGTWLGNESGVSRCRRLTGMDGRRAAGGSPADLAMEAARGGTFRTDGRDRGRTRPRNPMMGSVVWAERDRLGRC